MYDLRLQFVRGVQKAGQELGILKHASEEEDGLRAGSVAQAMQEEDMPVPGEEDLNGAAEILQALDQLEEVGSPAENAAADDAEEAIQKVQQLLGQKEAAAMDGSKQPEQQQVPHADSNLQSVNETQETGTAGSSSSVEGGEVGKEEGNKPPSQAQVPHADSNLQSVNETQETGTSGSSSAVQGGEVGDDKSEKSAGVGLFGTLETQEILKRLRNS